MSDPDGAATPEPVPQSSWWDLGSAERRLTHLVAPSAALIRPKTHSAVPAALIVLSGVAVMISSTLPWVYAHFLGLTQHVYGTSSAISDAIGINGWATFSTSAALVVLGAVLLAIESRASLGLAVLLAFANAGFAVYDTIRILNLSDKAGPALAHISPISGIVTGRIDVAYGLIIALCASTVGVIAASAEYRTTI